MRPPGGSRGGPPRRCPADHRVLEEAPEAPADLTVGFEEGRPVRLDGVRLDPVAQVTRLNELAGMHGVGRVGVVESSLLGIKTRAVYESPGGTVLHAAHRELEALCLDRHTLRLEAGLDQRYAELVYDGMWYSSLRSSLDTFVAATQGAVTGTVGLRLHKGSVLVTGREAARGLYPPSLSDHGDGDVFDHRAAAAFAYIWSMPRRVSRLASSPPPRPAGGH
ncbi:MAG: hypothetical protein ACRDJU_10540 [Actinomycetota bacterium]